MKWRTMVCIFCLIHEIFLLKILGGILTKEDLQNYRVLVHDSPLLVDGFSGNLRMCGPPPPSSFAVTQAIVATMTCKFFNFKKIYKNGIILFF